MLSSANRLVFATPCSRTDAARNGSSATDRYHADDHVIGQSYLWAAAHGAGPEAIAPLRKRFDEILAAPPRGSLATRAHESCDDRWCWCDALFMAPPVWIGLTAATGDQRYAEYAHAEFKATRDYLYDREEHLFYRDSRFFEQRDSNGRKLFWSRGNGWVFAGIARVLERLPANDPARPMYEGLFKEMAAKLKTVQKPDGYWAAITARRAWSDATGVEWHWLLRLRHDVGYRGGSARSSGIRAGRATWLARPGASRPI